MSAPAIDTAQLQRIRESVDPWAKALEAALADVKTKLGAPDAAAARAPLFADCDVVELLKREFTAPAWLVTGLVTRGGVTMIGAEPKAAKTWLGTEIAIAVATGTKVCGEFFAQAGRVAYFYAEDLDRQVRNRVRALLMGRRGIEAGRFFACPRGKFLDITDPQHLAWIVASCRALGAIDLLVLDPLRDIHSAEEDKSDAMSPVMKRLRVLAELLSCTVAVVHHSPKATKENATRRGGQNLRGSGAIHGSVDSGIYLRDPKAAVGASSSTFTNKVESEIKGARSAGVFSLELTVRDDKNGEATEASWKVIKALPSGAEFGALLGGEPGEEQKQNDAMVTFVGKLAARGIRLNRTKLRDHAERPPEVPHRKAIPTLDRVITLGRLRLIESFVRLPESQEQPSLLGALGADERSCEEP